MPILHIHTLRQMVLLYEAIGFILEVCRCYTIAQCISYLKPFIMSARTICQKLSIVTST